MKSTQAGQLRPLHSPQPLWADDSYCSGFSVRLLLQDYSWMDRSRPGWIPQVGKMKCMHIFVLNLVEMGKTPSETSSLP